MYRNVPTKKMHLQTLKKGGKEMIRSNIEEEEIGCYLGEESWEKRARRGTEIHEPEPSSHRGSFTTVFFSLTNDSTISLSFEARRGKKEHPSIPLKRN